MLVGMPLLRVFDPHGLWRHHPVHDRPCPRDQRQRPLILQDLFDLNEAAVAALNGSGAKYQQLLRRGRTHVHLESESWILIERSDQRTVDYKLRAGACTQRRRPALGLLLIDLDATPQPNTKAWSRSSA